ncbi:AAA ATPase-like domain-containing protein, nuclease domain-containing [Desulfonema limicola]|uniref:AAA ATPase-like domain-containing protein, nuclease domain-containing n=1 Tax=Desulfonema limicola TaxID=45656 RepID=A0A975B7C7_9BACT|nr:AAA family ATPase [Desulfonema limicola]QTA80133.1 AAA ATPase-like domain-containing protein, nuclease domain-containing [Desulfonema limicola]
MSEKPKLLPIGISDFKMLREQNRYYVDKTLFIKDIIEASAQVLLLPRPRRFGKTLNLSMLRYFFEHGQENQDFLFQNLAIASHDVFKKHSEQYPVIYLTFKDLKALKWEDCREGIYQVIAWETMRHLENMKNPSLSPPVKEQLEAIINLKATPSAYEMSLRLLSEVLCRHYNQKVVILIDEYDTPLHAGYSKGYYEDIISFMRNFLSGGLKDNTHLFKGVLTGILRVAKESVFSGLNNLDVYTILDENFNNAFGFTQKETAGLLNYFNMSHRMAEAESWYNGYLFGSEVIYNPWSILNFANRNNEKPAPYWINTADTSLIDKLATFGGKEIREEIGILLEGRSIIKPVHDAIVMRDLEKHPDILWSFLLFSGYLKTVRHLEDEMYELQIPNYEVKLIYRNLIRSWFAGKIEQNRVEDMLSALENKNVNFFEQMLKKIVMQVMSYHDLGNSPEKVYHALVLGILVWMSYKYEIRSNRESGHGRYDIMMKPKDKDKTGIIIEFKKVDKEKNESHEKAMEAALKQIEEKNYASELQAAGIRDILKLAVVFQGKELWVRKG